MRIGAEERRETAEQGGEEAEDCIKQIEYESIYDGRNSFSESHSLYLLSLGGVCFLYTIQFGVYNVTQHFRQHAVFHLTRRILERNIHAKGKCF